MFCTGCGKQLNTRTKFCQHCGSELSLVGSEKKNADFSRYLSRQNIVAFTLAIALIVGVIGFSQYKDALASAMANISSFILGSAEIEVVETPTEPEATNEKNLESNEQEEHQDNNVVQETTEPPDKKKVVAPITTPPPPPATQAPNTQAPPPQEDPTIKVALCKNKAEQSRSLFISTAQKRLDEIIQKQTKESFGEYQNCVAEAESYYDDLGQTSRLLPSEIGVFRTQAINACITAYKSEKDFIQNQYNISDYYGEADKYYRDSLNECLTK